MQTMHRLSKRTGHTGRSSLQCSEEKQRQGAGLSSLSPPEDRVRPCILVEHPCLPVARRKSGGGPICPDWPVEARDPESLGSSADIGASARRTPATRRNAATPSSACFACESRKIASRKRQDSNPLHSAPRDEPEAGPASGPRRIVFSVFGVRPRRAIN